MKILIFCFLLLIGIEFNSYSQAKAQSLKNQQTSQNSKREKYLEDLEIIKQLFNEEKFDIALNKAEDLIKDHPSFSEVLNIAADCLVRLNARNEAYNYYLKSLYLKADPDIYDKIHDVLKQKDNSKLIIIKLKRIISNKPNDFILKNILTSFYIDLKMYDYAISEAKAVLKINPWDQQALTNLAYSYIHKRKIKEAKKILSSIDEQEISSDRLHFLKAYLLIDSKNFAKSEEKLINAIKQNPFISSYYHTLASVYMKHNLFDKATALLENAIELEPQNEDLFLSLAQGYFLNNKIEKSLNVFSQITAFAPTSPSGYIGLGKLYLKLNQYNRTIKYFKRALNLDSSALSFLNLLEVYFQKYFYIIFILSVLGFIAIVLILKNYLQKCPKL
jgi:tetratricopeptide (TPR) repeat protein